jgi:glycogen debranching enzyme
VRGLARDRYVDQAAALAAGVVAASEGVAYRLPELYGGDQAGDVEFPVDYPASCRPQAWAAAAPLACLVAVTGLDVDAATGRVEVPERVGDRLGPFTLHGVRAGGQALTVRVGPGGDVSVEAQGAPLEPAVASSRDTP